MQIISRDPTLILTDTEYQTLNDAHNIIREIGEHLSDAEWEIVQHRFEYWLGDIAQEIDAVMRWADESEK